MSAHNIQQVSAPSDYNRMLEKMKEGSQKIKEGKWSLSEYYEELADFFDSLDPSSGIDVVDIRGVKYGGHFNFKRDAEDLRMLAKKE